MRAKDGGGETSRLVSRGRLLCLSRLQIISPGRNDSQVEPPSPPLSLSLSLSLPVFLPLFLGECSSSTGVIRGWTIFESFPIFWCSVSDAATVRSHSMQVGGPKR